MANDIEVLEKIKEAEARAERRKQEAQAEASKIIEAAKNDIPKIRSRAIADAEAYRNAVMEGAKKDAAEARTALLGKWAAKAKKLRKPDGKTMMLIFRKALKEKFDV
jgi:vacuolar-type H+-ATPase subunit H